MTPQPNQAIASLQPYQPGTPIATVARQLGIDEDSIIKLASNENPRGPSQRVIESIDAATRDLRLYPDTHDITQQLAEHHQVSPENIILGNGSNDILDLIARTYLTSGDESLMYEHSFLVYKLVSHAVGATVVTTPARDYGYDLTAIQQAITDTTRVIWIDNPNNPTGTLLPPNRLKDFIARVPTNVVVVLDEAYWDYVADDLRADTVRWVDEFPNLIITRTFSKLHGLAALRIGYGIASPRIIDALQRIRQPFNVNGLAIAAATAAITDTNHVVAERQANAIAMTQVCTALDRLNISYISSHANFVTAQFADAEQMQHHLLQSGIITRPIANYGLGSHLRITIGTKEQNEQLITAIKKGLTL